MKGNIIDAAKNLLNGDYAMDMAYYMYSVGDGEDRGITVSDNMCLLLLTGTGEKNNGSYHILFSKRFYGIYSLTDGAVAGGMSFTYNTYSAGSTATYTVGRSRWFVVLYIVY